MANTYRNHQAGTPDWHLHYLVQKLMDRQHRYDILESYHMGDHPLPPADPRYVKQLRKMQRMSLTNYVALVNVAPVQRMRVKGFRFGPEGKADDEAKMIWSANDMDLQSKKHHTGCSIFGDGYVLVGPPDEQTGYPTMVTEDPRVAITCQNPVFPTRSDAGLRMYEDPILGKTIAVLYMPDKTYVYMAAAVNDFHDQTKQGITDRLLGSSIGGGFTLVTTQNNELGEVPLVHFLWQPDYTDISLAEAEGVLHVQDRINYMILDRIKIAYSQAYRQRMIMGLPSLKGGPNQGPQKPPFDPGADTMWVVDDPNVKVHEFEATDFKQILEAVRDDIADLAAISQTPAHYLMNRMVNVSGDTLTQAESGFTAKTRLRMEAMDWGWTKCMKLAFKYLGNTKAAEVDAETMWANPMVRKDVDAADAASKWVAAGLELGLAMEHFGDFSDDEIIFAREKQEEAKDEERQMADRQMQIAETTARATTEAKTVEPADKQA